MDFIIRNIFRIDICLQPCLTFIQITNLRPFPAQLNKLGKRYRWYKIRVVDICLSYFMCSNIFILSASRESTSVSKYLNYTLGEAAQITYISFPELYYLNCHPVNNVLKDWGNSDSIYLRGLLKISTSMSLKTWYFDGDLWSMLVIAKIEFNKDPSASESSADRSPRLILAVPF